MPTNMLKIDRLRNRSIKHALCVCFSVCLLSGLLFQVGFSHESPPPVTEGENNASFKQYTLQPGTGFHVLLQSPLHTENNQLGDPVEAMMAQSLYLYNELMVPENTFFKGEIVQLDPPVQGRNAILAVKFFQMTLPNGDRVPISAYVKTERADHTWGGQSTDGTVPKKIVQKVWGLGDYNKVIMTGPRQMGLHIQAIPGEHWTIVLEQPVSLVKPTDVDNDPRLAPWKSPAP